jgi:hypothetical protein
VRDEGESASAIQIESSLQGRKGGQKRLSEAGDGPALVGDEVAASREEYFELCELFLPGGEFLESGPHPSLG